MAENESQQMDVICPKCNGYFSKSRYYFTCDCGEDARLPRMVCNVEITDNELESMLDGKATSRKTFKKKDGSTFQGRLKYENNKIAFDFSSGITCPKCGKEVTLNKGGAFCECDFKIFRKMASREFTDNEIKKLIKDGRLDDLSGFKSKAGKFFKANVVLTDNGPTFDFNN